jgi:hypothetical protein
MLLEADTGDITAHIRFRTERTMPEEYITKEIAAEMLGLSPRRALELADEGKIGKQESDNPQTKRRQTVLSAKDVKRLAAERQPGTALIAASASTPQLGSASRN